MNKSKNVEVDDIVDMLYKLDDGEVKDTVLTLEKQIEEKGREDGIKIGKADGIKIGKADGILEVAKNMKKLGFDIRDIVNSTGLSEVEIEAIEVY